VSWDQQFDDPIVLPGRKPLVTLRDAALYITKLPKAEHDADEWRAAMQAAVARCGAQRPDDAGPNRDDAGDQQA
jgi:hypothetical protein